MQTSILAQPGSRVSANARGNVYIAGAESLCVSQFLELPHNLIRTAALFVPDSVGLFALPLLSQADYRPPSMPPSQALALGFPWQCSSKY
jgi:hypothetical protein